MTYAIPYYPHYSIGDHRLMFNNKNMTNHNHLPNSPTGHGLPMYQPWHWPQPNSPSPYQYRIQPQMPNPLNRVPHDAPTNQQPSQSGTHYPLTNTTSSSTPPGTKRGRPRADIISTLQYVGSNSNSAIRCQICRRVFPREKSLQAHLRTHTGERPYRCDYPKCPKSFVQSGQLKTHQRLHSGEKPFLCSGKDCTVRFTHANRHCPEHPYAKLQRDDDGALKQLLETGIKHDPAVANWLEKYIKNRLDRSNSTQKSALKREYSDSGSDNESVTSSEMSEPFCHDNAQQKFHTLDQSNMGKICDVTPDRPSNHEPEEETPITKDRKILTPKRMNFVTPEICQPMKKRILAYVKEEQENIDVDKHGLPPLSSIALSKMLSIPEYTKTQNRDKDVNDNKCSVIVHANSVQPSTVCEKNENEKPRDEENRWNSALALIQLASSPPSKLKR